MTHEDCIAFFRRVKREVASVVQAMAAVVTQSELVFAFFVVNRARLAAFIAVPVSVAIGVGVFHTVSETADTLGDGSVTECELGIQMIALFRRETYAHENASLVVCEG